MTQEEINNLIKENESLKAKIEDMDRHNQSKKFQFTNLRRILTMNEEELKAAQEEIAVQKEQIKAYHESIKQSKIAEITKGDKKLVQALTTAWNELAGAEDSPELIIKKVEQAAKLAGIQAPKVPEVQKPQTPPPSEDPKPAETPTDPMDNPFAFMNSNPGVSTPETNKNNSFGYADTPEGIELAKKMGLPHAQKTPEEVATLIKNNPNK